MRYVFGVTRFDPHSASVALVWCCCLPVARWARNTSARSAYDPTYKEEAPDSFKELNQWQPRPSCGSGGRGKLGGRFLADPDLNKLEEQVRGSNQNLKIAEARFRSARAAIRFNRAPHSQPSPLRERQLMSRAQISPELSVEDFKRPARAISFCPLIFPMSLT